MTPEQAAAVARIREGDEQAAMCQPALPAILVSTHDVVAILAALDAAQAPQDVPRLTPAEIEKLGETLGERVPGHADYLSWGQGYRADESGRHTIPNLPAALIPFARAIESRVRELCGVAP